MLGLFLVISRLFRLIRVILVISVIRNTQNILIFINYILYFIAYIHITYTGADPGGGRSRRGPPPLKLEKI
jgi:hypothetical protein